MKDKNIKEMCDLCNLVGVSSREERIRKYIEKAVSGLDYQISVDNIGNLILRHKYVNEDLQRVMLFAHMDEIGFIVRKIETNGYIRFERLGGVNTQILPGTRVLFDGGQGIVKGVIGVQAHHFMPQENKFKVPQIKDMYMDIGAANLQEANEMGVDVGTYISLDATAEIVNKKYLRGKALDNRIAIALLIDVARNLEKRDLPFDLYFCFPVMEEFNIRGLLPVYRKIKPDISIGIDVTPSCDTPDLDYNNIALGDGPAVTCMNFHGGGTLAGVLPDEKLYSMVLNSAKNNKVKIQKEVSPGIITENAFGIFENESGIRVLNLSIPTRYTHTPIETQSLEDIQSLKKLINSVLLNDLQDVL